MKIAMTGATGYIGKHLSRYLTETCGHQVISLGRMMFREGMSARLAQALAHCDVIINLAGAPINKRWTTEYKRELIESRIGVTRRLVRALVCVRSTPLLMISASAVGYYPTTGECDEYTRTRGEGFLSDLCYAWEKEARLCPPQMRTIITRFGVVLSPNGGAMQQMLRPLQITRIATAIGPGSQPFPWIGINDLCRSMEFFIQNKETKGVYNLVVPQQVTQYAFTKVMGEAYHAFATLTIPQILFRMLYGESASFLTTGQAVRPTRLLEDGFQFTVPTVEQLFEEIYLSLRPISEH